MAPCSLGTLCIVLAAATLAECRQLGHAKVTRRLFRHEGRAPSRTKDEAPEALHRRGSVPSNGRQWHDRERRQRLGPRLSSNTLQMPASFFKILTRIDKNTWRRTHFRTREVEVVEGHNLGFITIVEPIGDVTSEAGSLLARNVSNMTVATNTFAVQYANITDKKKIFGKNTTNGTKNAMGNATVDHQANHTVDHQANHTAKNQPNHSKQTLAPTHHADRHMACGEVLRKVLEIVLLDVADGGTDVENHTLIEQALKILNSSDTGEYQLHTLQQVLDVGLAGEDKTGELFNTQDVKDFLTCELGDETYNFTLMEHIDNPSFVEGDMKTQNQSTLLQMETEMHSGRSSAKMLWTDGVVRYCFAGPGHEHPATYPAMHSVTHAIHHIEAQVPCVDFVEVGYSKETKKCETAPSVVIQSDETDGCWSYVGFALEHQPLNLGTGCESMGVAVHELLHALGLYHEQSRPDRELYLGIKWANIMPNVERNFEIVSSAYMLSDYDYLSVMHYGPYAFSTSPGKETTLTPKDALMTQYLGQRVGMSELDVRHVAEVYGCKEQAHPFRNNSDFGKDVVEGSGGVPAREPCRDVNSTWCSENFRMCHDANATSKQLTREACPATCAQCVPCTAKSTAAGCHPKSHGCRAAPGAPMIAMVTIALTSVSFASRFAAW